jgi:hypothetical protein
MSSNLTEKDKNFIKELVNAGLDWDSIVPKLAAYAIEEYEMQANDCALCKQVFYANLIREARKYY